MRADHPLPLALLFAGLCKTGKQGYKFTYQCCENCCANRTMQCTPNNDGTEFTTCCATGRPGSSANFIGIAPGSAQRC